MSKRFLPSSPGLYWAQLFDGEALANDVIVSPVQMRYREFYGLTGDQQPQVKVRWMGPLRRPSSPYKKEDET